MEELRKTGCIDYVFIIKMQLSAHGRDILCNIDFNWLHKK